MRYVTKYIFCGTLYNTKFWRDTSWNFCTSLSVTEWLTSYDRNKRKVRAQERLGRVLGCGFGFSRVHWTYYGTDEHSSVKWKYYANAQTAVPRMTQELLHAYKNRRFIFHNGIILLPRIGFYKKIILTAVNQRLLLRFDLR